MQTHLSPEFAGTPDGEEAQAIIRKCVHCGFCNATCPTYQLLGDELDGPRGRIYLMKQMLEGASPTAKTRLHLDRCLTCRACETTCPSGVQYGRLVDIGRGIVEEKAPRGIWQTIEKKVLAAVLPRTGIFAFFLALGRIFGKAPAAATSAGDWPAPRHKRRMLALPACWQ